MILYHGTGSHAALRIFKDGLIKRASRENSPYKYEGSDQTTYGYVYATDDEKEAFFYGSNASRTMRVGQVCHVIYIFEIDIERNLVQPDKYDECRHRKWSFEHSCPTCDVETCLTRTKSAIIAQDIKIGGTVKRYKMRAVYGNKHKLIHDWKPVSQSNAFMRTIVDFLSRNKTLFNILMRIT